MLEAGTVVGDETEYPWQLPDGSDMRPSTQMTGLDEEGKQKVDELHQELYGTSPSWQTAMTPKQEAARKEEAEKQHALNEGSDPVSPQQAYEREIERMREEWSKANAGIASPKGGPKGDKPAMTHSPAEIAAGMPGPGRQPSSTATASPSKGGVNAPAKGPATPRPPEGDKARDIKPNEDQYPKD